MSCGKLDEDKGHYRTSDRMRTYFRAAIILIFFSTAAAENNTVVTLSANESVLVGDNFTVYILITPGEPIYGAEIKLLFDNTSLSGTHLEKGSLLKGMNVISTINNEKGEIWYAETLIRNVPGISSKGILANATFTAKKADITSIHFNQITLVNDKGKKITNVSYNTFNLTIHEKERASNISAAVLIMIIILALLIWKK